MSDHPFSGTLQTEKELASYVYVSCSAIMIWDVLENLNGEYKMLRHYHIGFPIVVYFVSRLFSLAFVILITVFQTARISTCMRFEDWMAGVYTVAIAFTSLLFTLRVRAIWEGNKYITGFFGFLWLVVVGTAAMTTQAVTVVRIGATEYCINEHVAGYVTSAAVAPLVNDTLVFLAISWRLMQNSLVGGKRRFCLRAMILGQRTPSLSHALLKDGQVYYLTTVSSNLLTVILMIIPALPETYRPMLAGPNIMLMNIMACRVFRKTKLGVFDIDNGTIPIFHADDSSSRQRTHPLTPITFRKVNSQGSPSESITIDLGTKELYVEHI